ncbi:MAG: hypothetical protein OEV02_10620, partial [Gammaproteobacteria bacterium]|nr:hypothetical protein [Gammaproteobacteria bacterium]
NGYLAQHHRLLDELETISLSRRWTYFATEGKNDKLTTAVERNLAIFVQATATFHFLNALILRLM